MIEYITLSDLVKKVSQDAVEKGKEIFNTKKIREKYINIFEMMNIDRDKLKASDCKQSKDFKIPKDSQKFLIEVYWLYSDADMKKMRKGLFEQASLESIAGLLDGFREMILKLDIPENDKDEMISKMYMRTRYPYIAIPKVSSQNRRYIPMDYLEGEIIPGDKLFTMPSATSYEFGILMSNVHMAWTRAVCGRLKSDYSYSNMIVYNNFPWPSPTNDQKEKIRKTAQAILNARAFYTDSNLADLYDPLTMPTELLKAHKANNRAVMHAYGFSIKMSEADCVAELMRMYQKLTKEK